MKKILCSCILAILVVGGLSAFKKKPLNSKKNVDAYWFQVNPGYGLNNYFTNAEVYYISGPDENPPTEGYTCFGTGVYKCVVGFNWNQLIFPTHQLVNGMQSYSFLGYTRNTQ